MPDGCWALRRRAGCGHRATLGSLAGLRPEQASTPRRGDRPLGECLAAAAEKEQAEPHVDERTPVGARRVAPPAGLVRIVDRGKSRWRSASRAGSRLSGMGEAWRRCSRSSGSTSRDDDGDGDVVRDLAGRLHRRSSRTTRCRPRPRSSRRPAPTETSERYECWLLRDGGRAGRRLPARAADGRTTSTWSSSRSRWRRSTSAAATAGSCSTHALAAGRRARPAPGDRRRQRAGRRVAEPGDAVRRRGRRQQVARRDAPHPGPGRARPRPARRRCGPRPSRPPTATSWCPGPAPARTTWSTATRPWSPG